MTDPIRTAEAIVRCVEVARILRNAAFVRRALPRDYAAWLRQRRLR